MGFEGGEACQKKWLQGWGAGKIHWVKRGGQQKNSFKFCNDNICDNANNLPECQNPAFEIFRKFRFSREACPRTLCLIVHKKPIKMRKKTYHMYRTIYRTYHCEKKNLYCHNKKMECLLPLRRVVGKQSNLKKF